MENTYCDPVESFYEDYNKVIPTGYISRSHKKSKRFYFWGCLGNKHHSKDVIYEPSKTNDYMNQKTIQIQDCMVYPFSKGPAPRDYTMDKEVKKDQAMEDKTTQIPDVVLAKSDKSENSKTEGVISMSISDSDTEDRTLESLIRNQTSVAKIFDRYGLNLQSIEKGSILFKFIIPSRECDSACMISEENVGKLVREVCREALQSISGCPGLDDIIIEVYLSSQIRTCYNIAADVVQIGNHNKVYMSPAGDASSETPQPAACGQYLTPTTSDPSREVSVKAVTDAVSTLTNTGHSREKTISFSETPEPCIGNPDSGFGSGGAQGGGRTDQTDETAVKTSCQPTPSTPQTKSEGRTDETDETSEKTSCQPTSSTLQTKSVVTLQPRHSAHILFRAPDAEKMSAIEKELYALKRVSFLEFKLISDYTAHCVTICIFKHCVTVKDFYTSVVQFPVYPHLMSTITTNMIDVTIEIPADTLDDSPYVNTGICPHDASIHFKARNEDGMKTIMDELESMKSISTLKFDVKTGNPSNCATVVIKKNISPVEDFFAEVLNFTTFVHLMEEIVDNLVDVKICITSRDNTPLYDTLKLDTETEADYKTLAGDPENSIRSKSKPKTSGLPRLFSSLRRSIKGKKHKTQM